MKLVASEADHQHVFTQWLDLNQITYFAVPNGGKRGWKAQRQAKKEGIKAGVPDLVVLLYQRAVFIEMKKKGGRVSPKQKEWVSQLQLLGYDVAVCYSSQEAREFIEGILNAT